jgi:hypothetical protein
MGERRGVYWVLVGRPKGKRPLGRPKWEDSIKMHLQDVGSGKGGIEWTDLAQDSDRWQTLTNQEMNLGVP